MKVISTELEGVLIVEPDVFQDRRGFFMETYHQKRYAESGIDKPFVQDNLSCSFKGALRGLHYQIHHEQGKLIQVIRGEIFDVAVDIRRGSPTFGQWTFVRLSESNRLQIYVPEGFAHGFCVLSEDALVMYKCTNLYVPGAERGVLWSDPELGISWPVQEPLLSPKDSANPRLKEIPIADLPVYDKSL